MAITTVDGALAGMKPPERYAKTGITTTALAPNRFHCTIYETGVPGAAVANSAGINGAALTSYLGQIPIPAASGNTHLARFSGTGSSGCTLILCDRLWHNSGLSVTSTSLQSITPAAIPARDADGTTAGRGVIAAIEVSTTMGAGTPTITLTYTNSAGTGSRTGAIAAVAATAPVGTYYSFPLQAGDLGVRSVEGYQASATMTSGAIHLVLYRVIATVSTTTPLVEEAVDLLTSGFPRLYDTSVPFIIRMPTGTGATNIAGGVVYAQG